MQLHCNLNYSRDQLLSEKNYFFLIVVLNLSLNNLNSSVGDCVLLLLVSCLQLMLAAWLNVVGAVGRIISTLFAGQPSSYVVLLISQTVCACAQPFAMFSPTKLAAQWFHQRQRTFANMIASIGTQQLSACTC